MADGRKGKSRKEELGSKHKCLKRHPKKRNQGWTLKVSPIWALFALAHFLGPTEFKPSSHQILGAALEVL